MSVSERPAECLEENWLDQGIQILANHVESCDLIMLIPQVEKVQVEHQL